MFLQILRPTSGFWALAGGPGPVAAGRPGSRPAPQRSPGGRRRPPRAPAPRSRRAQTLQRAPWPWPGGRRPRPAAADSRGTGRRRAAALTFASARAASAARPPTRVFCNQSVRLIKAAPQPLDSGVGGTRRHLNKETSWGWAPEVRVWAPRRSLRSPLGAAGPSGPRWLLCPGESTLASCSRCAGCGGRKCPLIDRRAFKCSLRSPSPISRQHSGPGQMSWSPSAGPGRESPRNYRVSVSTARYSFT